MVAATIRVNVTVMMDSLGISAIWVRSCSYCHHGWKGPECDVKSTACLVPNCNNHGRCNNRGQCDCDDGFTGHFCDMVACPHPDCNGNGACVDSQCYCAFGWRGDSCDIPFSLTPPQSDTPVQCVYPDSDGLSNAVCSGHGRQSVGGQCECENGWAGDNCQKERCSLDCGSRGVCFDGACVCDYGWAGSNCEALACRHGCEEHGTCKNGTCMCDKGWNGDNCQLEGCINMCHNRGECRQFMGNWRCDCSMDFTGHDCSVPLEFQCDDGIDNDGDGLTDCEDSECCGAERCEEDPLCHTVYSPLKVLIRKQPPPPQASFFQKTSFLLEPDSVQQYPDLKLFNDSRAAVVRGRVIHSKGGALIGVRVTDVENALYGFTITRSGGEFDLMVNGGGSVTLQFMRLPFGSSYRTVNVPWNRIVHIGDIVMHDEQEASDLPEQRFGILRSTPPECQGKHDPLLVRPYLHPSWKMTRFGGRPGWNGILADAQAVYASVPVTDMGVHLSYTSASAPGYESTLLLYLVPPHPPANLRRVRLAIRIEGVRTERILAAMPNLTYTFGWERRNVYKQKVYGLTIAEVSVGYEYDGCDKPFWMHEEVKMAGFGSAISDIGGWNLDIHHHLDPVGGVLEKGDGTVRYLAEESPLLRTVVGTGQQRPIECGRLGSGSEPCDGPADTAQLFLPMALATGKEGSLFVGDYNIVRRLTPNNTMLTVLELSPADTAHPYHLAVHPASGDLYVSLPLRRQIWRVLQAYSPASVPNPAANYEVFAGSGSPCVLVKECGDRGPALMANLNFPKGLAFTARGVLFFADERKIRMIDGEGIISTSVDAPGSAGEQPSCDVEFPLSELKLNWPTHLAFSPLSEHLLILDSDIVYEIESQETARILAGTPSYCRRLRLNRTLSNQQDSSLVSIRPTVLESARSIAVTPDGRLLIAESDNKRIHRIRTLEIRPKSQSMTSSPASGISGANAPLSTMASHLELLAGAESNCDCDRANCPCDDTEWVLASDAHLHLPVDIAISPAGRQGGSTPMIYVADQGNLKIRAISPILPHLEPSAMDERHYDLYDAAAGHVYSFNRHGQHTTTRSILTGDHLYNFTYHLDTSFGRLIQVTGSGGHKLYIDRREAGMIHLKDSNGRRLDASLSHYGMLETLRVADGATSRFEYDANTGLLTGREDPSGRLWFFDYDYEGHVRGMVTPTGDTYRVGTVVSGDSLVATLFDDVDGKELASFVVKERSIDVHQAYNRHTVFMSAFGNRGFQLVDPTNQAATYDARSHSLLAPYQTALLRRKITIPETLSPARPAMSHKLEWRWYVRRGPRSQTRRSVPLLSLGSWEELPRKPYPKHRHAFRHRRKHKRRPAPSEKALFDAFGTVEPSEDSPVETLATLGMEALDRVRRAAAATTESKRILQINGMNVLSVVYDRSRHVDNIIDQDNNVLLTLTYNAAGQVTQWIPSAHYLAPMNISYDPMGRVIHSVWGGINSSFAYDEEGRLAKYNLIRLGKDSEQGVWKLSYKDAKKLPVTVTSPSGNIYRVAHDDTGALQHIATPGDGSSRHTFYSQNELGSINSIYVTPGSNGQTTFLSRTDDTGRPLGYYYPERTRRATFMYPRVGPMLSQAYGGLDSFAYDNTTGLVTSVQVEQPRHIPVPIDDVAAADMQMDSNYLPFQLNTTLSYQGHILAQTAQTRKLGESPFTAHFTYRFDNALRLASVQATIADVTLQPLKPSTMLGLAASDDPASVGSVPGQSDLFKFQLLPDGKLRIMSERFVFERQLGPTSDIRQQVITIQGRTVIQQVFGSQVVQSELTEGVPTRVRQLTMKQIVNSETSESAATLNTDGYIAHYSESGTTDGAPTTYTYEYLPDGRLASLNNATVRYGDNYLDVTAIGNLNIECDGAGFLMKLTSSSFAYDGFGRLTSVKSALPTGLAVTEFFYDASGRLVTATSVSTADGVETWQFFYAFPNEANQVTHSLHKREPKEGDATSELSVYYYDPRGLLFALERGGRWFAVNTLPNGTPSHVFDDDGNIVKVIARTPTGALATDSAPKFRLPIGHRGGLQFDWLHSESSSQSSGEERLSGGGVVFLPDSGSELRARPYDALTGRWMSLPVPVVLGRGAINPYRPQSVADMFSGFKSQFDMPDQPKDIKDWLNLMGHSLHSILPFSEDTSSIISSGSMYACPSVRTDSIFPFIQLGSQCAISAEVGLFDDLQSVRPSGLVAQPVLPTEPVVGLRLSALPSVYGQGVLPAIGPDRVAALRLMDFGTERFLQDAMLLLLNETSVIPHCTRDPAGRTHHYFVKPLGASYTADLAALGVNNVGEDGAHVASLTRHINLTFVGPFPSKYANEGTTPWNQGVNSVLPKLNQVSVSTKFSSVHVLYLVDDESSISKSIEGVRTVLLNQAEAEAAGLAWKAETAKASRGSVLGYGWTRAELAELAVNGLIAGYTLAYRDSVKTLATKIDIDSSQLASDPQAMRFVAL